MLAVGVLVLALLGGALAYYLTQIPDELAKDYHDEALPEQQRVRKAMRPVYRTMSIATFGANNKPIEKAKNERQYVKALEKVSSKELAQLTPARRAIDKAKRTLAKVDEDKLLELPDAPLLDGRGKLADAEDIVTAERRYLDRARRFLRDYDKLIAYLSLRTKFIRDTGVDVGRGFDKIPQTFTSPGQFTGPVEGVIKTLRKELRKFRKVKPPADVKREHGIDVHDTEFLIARLGDMNAAARRLDNAGLRKAFSALSREGKRSVKRTKNSVPRLVTRSRAAKSIRELRKRERQLLEAFEKL